MATATSKRKREKHTHIQWKRSVSLESKIIFKITKWKYWTEKCRIWNKFFQLQITRGKVSELQARVMGIILSKQQKNAWEAITWPVDLQTILKMSNPHSGATTEVEEICVSDEKHLKIHSWKISEFSIRCNFIVRKSWVTFKYNQLKVNHD